MGERALETVLFTLKAMANGGMYDHVGQVSEAIISNMVGLHHSYNNIKFYIWIGISSLFN